MRKTVVEEFILKFKDGLFCILVIFINKMNGRKVDEWTED